MKKFLPWATLVIGLIWVIHNPVQAGNDVHRLVNDIITFASSF